MFLNSDEIPIYSISLFKCKSNYFDATACILWISDGSKYYLSSFDILIMFAAGGGYYNPKSLYNLKLINLSNAT